MTQRKPAGMRFETWIERQLREAQDRGEFDDLPGKGKPLAGIDDPPDDLWWVKQWLRRENVSFLPPALALRKEVEDFREQLAEAPSEAAVRESVAALNAKIRALNGGFHEGPPSTLMPIDVEAAVERWRAATA